VDGDTVTVIMNGNIIFSKQGLSTKANSKTIQIPSSLDSVNLVMYAESLGEIPPNTGLLVVLDGEKRYEIRFSADLKSNAAIIFRRKKNE
jgi:archaellum component FlaG (FlaF/FlaG flagellin family)